MNTLCGAGPAVQAARDDQRRLDVAQFGRMEAEDEVVADVRVLDVEEQAVAHDPLVAELVGRVRAGVPPVLAEASRRTAPCGVVVSIGWRSSAPRALRSFFAKLLKSDSLLPLKSWTSPFRLVVCSSVLSVLRQALTSLIETEASGAALMAWHAGVGL